MAKILIVDDSRTSRKILRNILEENGHEIIGEAVNGLTGIEKCKELEPDLVTMDITMPQMDGIEALRQIMEYDKELKVVMATAAGQKDKMLQAIKIGAVEYISKPFEPDKVIKTINSILSH